MRPLRALAATAVALALLAGCSDDDPAPTKPSSTPTESHSPTASPTPKTPEEPTLPDAATRATEAGARAFITYYWDLINYAQVTGDVKALKRVSGPGCNGCDIGISAVSDHYARGGHIEGGDYAVSIVKINQLKDPNLEALAFEAKLRARNEPQVITHGDGAEERHKAGQSTALVAVLWTDKGWRLEAMEIQ
ncbi:DUF6318 family protein [Nocardioides sp. J54]|uniref:DUF6318 family protein n=1 Tax=Nocardioides sp. J54 TaxID=935866 RepID=UPI0004AD2C36|nr:DUF6318 family protein [Nocardioides sp. J54]